MLPGPFTAETRASIGHVRAVVLYGDCLILRHSHAGGCWRTVVEHHWQRERIILGGVRALDEFGLRAKRASRRYLRTRDAEAPPGLTARIIKHDRALVHSSQLLHHVRDEKRL